MRFQPGEGPSRGLIRDYEPSDGPSFEALLATGLIGFIYSSAHPGTLGQKLQQKQLW